MIAVGRLRAKLVGGEYVRKLSRRRIQRLTARPRRQRHMQTGAEAEEDSDSDYPRPDLERVDT